MNLAGIAELFFGGGCCCGLEKFAKPGAGIGKPQEGSSMRNLSSARDDRAALRTSMERPLS
jgi:hypothetical protein